MSQNYAFLATSRRFSSERCTMPYNGYMAKVLVIPDTHLKPKMFDLAEKILRENKVDYAIQLGDNFDDFYCYEKHYRKHYERMIKFREAHPETIWLFGETIRRFGQGRNMML